MPRWDCEFELSVQSCISPCSSPCRRALARADLRARSWGVSPSDPSQVETIDELAICQFSCGSLICLLAAHLRMLYSAMERVDMVPFSEEFPQETVPATCTAASQRRDAPDIPGQAPPSVRSTIPRPRRPATMAPDISGAPGAAARRSHPPSSRHGPRGPLPADRAACGAPHRGRRGHSRPRGHRPGPPPSRRLRRVCRAPSGLAHVCPARPEHSMSPLGRPPGPHLERLRVIGHRRTPLDGTACRWGASGRWFKSSRPDSLRARHHGTTAVTGPFLWGLLGGFIGAFRGNRPGNHV